MPSTKGKKAVWAIANEAEKIGDQLAIPAVEKLARGEGSAAQLLADEVLLDLLLHRDRERDAGPFEEPDLHGLGIRRRRADVERCVVPLRLQEMLADRCGKRP